MDSEEPPSPTAIKLHHSLREIEDIIHKNHGDIAERVEFTEIVCTISIALLAGCIAALKYEKSQDIVFENTIKKLRYAIDQLNIIHPN